jgi:hypothetical protein
MRPQSPFHASGIHAAVSNSPLKARPVIMAWMTLKLAIVLGAVGQAATAPPTSPVTPMPAKPSEGLALTAEQIAVAITQLGDDRIAVRDAATERLWRGGLDVQPSLEAARKHPDGEIRLRAESILSRFRYGLFADTPPELAEQIKRFHRSEFNSRSAVLRELIVGGGVSTAVALVRGEPNPQQRSMAKSTRSRRCSKRVEPAKSPVFWPWPLCMP